MKKNILLLAILMLLPSLAGAQNEAFEQKTFIHKGDSLHYRVLFPKNYDKKKKYPLVVFLHGAGERGNDNLKQLKNGAALFTDEKNREQYPAIVLFPQCPTNDAWVDAIRSLETDLDFEAKAPVTPSLTMVERLIKWHQKNERVDKKRIYAVGLSMGGAGTFELIVRQPKKFAAAIPICGGIHQSRLKKVRKMPIRIYHGAADDIVSPDFSRNAFIKLGALGSKKVEYKEYTGVAHDSWNNAFAEKDFLSWLFAQKR